jgi:hypothetical protein
VTALLIIAWLLLLLSAAAGLYWAIVWRRVANMLRERPTVRAGLDAPVPEGGWPRLSVIVPAHNEQSVIDTCCASLRGQDYPKLEIIFILDRCTDRTREIVTRHAREDARISVIENDSCPLDWSGKCNAARIGAEHSSGEYLIFTDADTQFDPALCRSTVALAMQRGYGLLSLLSTLTYHQRFERIAQPVATMMLMRMYPPRRQGSAKKTRPFANGQFMLFPRTWYERIGGHEAVKDDLLEDLAFAKLVQDADGDCAALLADGMLRCAMYESLQEFKTGWKRIFIEACRRRPPRLRKNAWRGIVIGLGLPAVQVMAVIVAAALLSMDVIPLPLAIIAVVIAALAIQFAALVKVYAAAGAPIASTFYYPLGCWITARAMLEGARDLEMRTPVKWGGREYVLEPRG